MLAGSTPRAGDNGPTYTRSVFEAILDGLGPHDPFREHFLIDDHGVRIKEPSASCGLEWHPLCELMAPGSPNPLDEPWLPFPFSARQLAALMSNGWGYFIREKYGDWGDGPDQNELASIGVLGGKGREALAAAYEAHRHAVAMAPKLDEGLAVADQDLVAQYDRAREDAMSLEQLREPGISDDEYTERLGRVNESVRSLAEQLSQARKAANDAESTWRRDVVQHLLLPIDEVPAEAFRCQKLRGVPAERRAEAIHQQRADREFVDSDVGQAHWALVCEQSDVEHALRRWQLLNPQSVTEALAHEAKVRELDAKLQSIKERLAEFERPSMRIAILPSGSSTAPKLDLAMLATRDELCAAFGGFGLSRKWFNDLGSRQWLLGARKVVGHGQRGHRQEPLYCPFEVMTGLVEKSRKSRLQVDAGWRILEARFPAVYGAKSVADPRDRSG